MVRWLFRLKSNSVTSAAAILAVASLISRFIGIFRDRLLSGTFGAGAELDAYYAAFRAPDLLYNLLVLGAISAGFIPVFTAYVRGKGSDTPNEQEGWDLSSRLLSIMGVALAVFSVIGIIAAPLFVPLMTPGFEPVNQTLTVALARVMFLSPVFLGLSSVLGGILQTYRRFFIYASAPILYNVGIIFGIVALTGTYGVFGVAIGVAFGSFLHFLIQLIACHACGFRFSFMWNVRHAGLRKIGRMMAPRTAALAITQLNLVVIMIIASTLGDGGITVFNLANNLQSFPVGILGVSFAIAAFPLISELASHGSYERFKEAVTSTARAVIFLIIPATIGFLLLRAQIVRVILGSGEFDWADTIATSDTLAFFTLSLFAQALLPLIVRSFFALHDVKTPLLIGLVAVLTERLVAWRLVGAGMGVPGLALAFSVGSIVNVSLLWVSLRLRIGSLGEAKIFRALIPLSVAGAVMALVIQGLKVWLATMVDMQTFVGIFSQGFGAGIAGLAAYFAVAFALGSPEARHVLSMYRRKVTPLRETVVVQNEDTLSGE